MKDVSYYFQEHGGGGAALSDVNVIVFIFTKFVRQVMFCLDLLE